MKVYVIIPVRNEERYIVPCLTSLMKFERNNNFDFYFIVVDGCSNDRTVEVVESLDNPRIKIISNPKKSVPYALNAAIHIYSDGDFYIRADAHAIYPYNYINLLIDQSILFDADNYGGVLDVLPSISDSSVSNAIACVMSSRFGVGSSLFRVGVNKITKVDTVPFGCFPSRVFKKYGDFDLDMVRNQDDEFNSRIINNGGSIYLDPGIVVKYFARDSVLNFSKMLYQYALFKPLGNKKCGGATSIRQFIPFLFVVSTLFLFIAGSFFPLFWCLLFLLFVVYFSVGIYFYFTEMLPFNTNLLNYLFVAFVGHLSYGFGYFLGLIRLIGVGKKLFNVNLSR